MKNHFSVSGFLLSFQFYRRIINLLFGKSNKLINCTATTGHRSKTLIYPFIYCYFLCSVECRGLCMHNFGWKHHKYFKMLNWVLLIFEGRTCALSHKMTLCCLACVKIRKCPRKKFVIGHIFVLSQTTIMRIIIWNLWFYRIGN